MPLTLAQYAMDEKEPLRKGAMLGLIQEGIVTDLLTWRKINGLHEAGVRYDEVPTPAFIPLDGTISEDTVEGHPIEHTVFRMAHHIDIPVPLEDMTADLIQKPSSIQTKLALKGAAYVVNDKFINGDQATDINAFDGINKLVSNLASSQTVNAASEIDLVAPSTAEIHDWIDLIEAGMHAVSGHKPTCGFANSQTLLKLESCLRREQLLGDHYNWKEAALDVNDPRRSMGTASTRPAFIWRDIPFYDLGVKGDQTTQIMLNTYTEGGSTATGSRIFFVKLGDDELEGIQGDPLNVRPIGLLEDKDNYRFRLTWTLGTALWGPKSISKVQGFRVV